MSEKKYSVIIPVYNSEKTLKRCLDSLLSQGREDAEIIIVNDGSSDRSEQLIAGYLQNNPGILYLKQTNKGVSSARNHGLEKASGQYITFVDSDDFVADTYFQELDRMGGIQDADLIMFSQKTVGGPGENEAVLYQKLARMQDRAEILELLLSSRKIMTPWNKRFKRSLIERYHIRFQKRMQTGEDFNFCLAYAVCCGSLAVVDSKIYCVDISDRKSLSRRYRPKLDQLLSDVFVTAAKTVRGSRLGTSEKARLLRVIDYLFTKNVFTCIAEEFKVSRPDYRKDKERAEEICRQFRKKLCRKGEYYGVVHFALRLMIRCRMTFLMYQVASVVKGRAFGVYAEEQCFMSRIKILIVAGAMDVGGIENQLMHLLRNADREKFQIDYTSTMEHAYYRDEIERLGGQYIVIPEMNWKNPLPYCRALYRTMKNGSYDVVHSHELFHSGIVMYLARRAGIRGRFVHAHNWSDGDGTGRKRSLPRRIYNCVMRRMILRYSNQQIACSTLAGKFLFGEKTVAKSSYHLVYNSVDTSKFIDHYGKSETGEFTGDGWINVLHVGRVTVIKNQLFLVKMAEIFRQRGENIRILCAGNGDKNYEDQVKRQIKEHHLEPYIKMLGVRGDIDVLMRKSKAFVLPSLYEGMPLVMIEAQAAGLPCVAADTFSHEVDFELDRVCWLDLSLGTEAWCDAVEKAIRLPFVEKNRVNNAIADKKFDSRMFAEIVCGLYEKAVRDA